MESDGMTDTTWGTHCDMRNVSRITGLDWTFILVSEIEMPTVAQVVVVALTETVVQQQHVQVMGDHARLVLRNYDCW